MAEILTSGTALKSGKYIITGYLGRGGFGITYKATDTDLQRTVAVKEFFPETCFRNEQGTVTSPPAHSEDFETQKKKVRQEARILANIKHPGVVNVYDFFEEIGTAFYVMEWVDGKSLKDLVKAQGGGHLSAGQACRYILEVLQALQAIHQKNILHRDIAPDNIMVSTTGQAVIIDFGSARRIDDMREGAHMKTLLVKSGYSPREFYAQQERQGPWSDTYSLAATLYFCLSGQYPPNCFDLQSQTLPVLPTGQESYYRFLAKGMAENPEGRYPTALQMEMALKQLTTPGEDDGPPERDPVPPDPDQTKGRKNDDPQTVTNYKKALLGALLILIFLTSGYWIFGPPSAKEQVVERSVDAENKGQYTETATIGEATQKPGADQSISPKEAPSDTGSTAQPLPPKEVKVNPVPEESTVRDLPHPAPGDYMGRLMAIADRRRSDSDRWKRKNQEIALFSNPGDSVEVQDEQGLIDPVSYTAKKYLGRLYTLRRLKELKEVATERNAEGKITRLKVVEIF